MNDPIAAMLQGERERLMREAGLPLGPIRHFRQHPEAPFTRSERERVTVWFGGLTMRHKALILAALEGRGYRVGVVPTPPRPTSRRGRPSVTTASAIRPTSRWAPS